MPDRKCVSILIGYFAEGWITCSATEVVLSTMRGSRMRARKISAKSKSGRGKGRDGKGDDSIRNYNCASARQVGCQQHAFPGTDWEKQYVE